MAAIHLIHNIRDAVEKPLTTPLDAEHLFLIVGVVVVAAGFWIMILSHVMRDVGVE